MAWVAVDKHGDECIYKYRPIRSSYYGCWMTGDDVISLPKGTIRRLLGVELTWANEPVELKEE